MKNSIKYFILINIMLLPQVWADAWYNNVGAHMGRIEQGSNGQIWLMRPTNDRTRVTISGDGESCYINQVKLIPPTGKEKEWLSMVLTATISGKALNVYGTCNNSTTTIDVVRLVLEY